MPCVFVKDLAILTGKGTSFIFQQCFAAKGLCKYNYFLILEQILKQYIMDIQSIKNEIIQSLKFMNTELEMSYNEYTSNGVSLEQLQTALNQLEEENLIEIIERYPYGVLIILKQ